MPSGKGEVKEVFGQCRERALQATPEIVDALIKQAKGGSYQHAKFLFEFVQAEAPREKEDDDLPGPSLAEILLERLQLIDPEDPDAPPHAESASGA